MKHFIDISDVSAGEILELIELAFELKEKQRAGIGYTPLSGKVLAMIFSKSSTRTRASFEAGMYQLGGYPMVLNAADLQIGRGEPICDTARVLSRYADGIMIRTYDHEDVLGLARFGTIPVINGLSDDSHPCQVLADLMTVKEYKGRLKGVKLAYVGDGNNVANTLLQACPKVGVDIAVATPARYACDEKYVSQARAEAASTGASVTICTDPAKAVAGADVVYTDTWVSMGMEADGDERVPHFKGYEVDAALMSLAQKDAIFLHCLPAYRGMEVSDEVIEGPASVVFEEAENRLHSQKAVMAKLMG
ncbi:MAG: ornithine carbamoyltransferase [Oscillospiraceae bacterium]|nr:ornithine carbamoyltransferase [Oscillospiraceae bacterium]